MLLIYSLTQCKGSKTCVSSAGEPRKEQKIVLHYIKKTDVYKTVKCKR